MADEDKKVIDEDAIKAEAHTEATEKIAEDVKNKKSAVESSIKDVLTDAGLDAEFTQKEDKLVVEIPLSNQEEKDALVAKMVAEKMKQAEEEAARKAAEEVAKRQAEIEAAAREKAEQEAREKAESEARAKAKKEAAEAAAKAEAEEKERKAAEEAAALEAKKAAEAEEKARKEAEAIAAKAAEEARKVAEAAEKAKLEAEKQAADEAAKAKKAEEAAAAKAEAAKTAEAKKKAQEETKKRNSELAEKAKAEKKAAAPKKAPASDKFIPNFKRLYLEKARPELQKEFNYSSPMQIPRLTKITVSVGCGDAVANKKYLDAAVKELEQITGQHVLRTKARKAIANFKIRQGMEIGAMVTLRGDNMWYFLERLISIALPRVRDFRGVKKTSFDGRGNYSLGITEQIIFPEIDFDKIERVSGLNVAIVTTAESDKEGYALLKALGMPFVR